MGIEIERKYLLAGDAWRKLAKGIHYRQGYLNSDKNRTVRVRTVNDKGFLTIKGINVGATCLEFEYAIPKTESKGAKGNIHFSSNRLSMPINNERRNQWVVSSG